MGRGCDFIRNYTNLPAKLDYLLAPFSEASFQRLIARPPARVLVLLAASLMLAVTIGGILLCLIASVERLYLLAGGVSTRAIIEKVETKYVLKGSKSGSTAISRWVEWTNVTYVFTARKGERILGTLRREATELRDLGRGSSLEVLYVERWPQINLPRRRFDDLDDWIVMLLLYLGASLHPVLMLRRYWRWRRGPASTSARSSAMPNPA
jgi:hypothetical protein